MDWYIAHYAPDPAQREDPRASPLREPDLGGLAPAYVAVAGFDPLRDEGIAYAGRLLEAGVEVELDIHRGLIHAFINMSAVSRGCDAALRRPLRRGPGPARRLTGTGPRTYPSRQMPEDIDTRFIAPLVGAEDERVFTDSGIEIEPLYTEDDVAPGLEQRLGEPGSPPFTRGIHERMYRDRLWTMRQYAGFASAEDTNQRYRYLIEHGSTGLSMAFDLPTQLGRDSDDPLCRGEVGRTGVPIDTIEDMRICFEAIPLDGVSTSMTINAPAAILLLLYELVGEEQGVPPEKLRGTVQNDVLKEYMARGNYIFPPVRRCG